MVFVWVEVAGVRVFSCYFSPNDPFEIFETQILLLEESLREASGWFLIACDFNSKSPEWGEARLDKRGILVGQMIARNDRIVLNRGRDFTFSRGARGSIIDLTLAAPRLASRIDDRCGLEVISLSNHRLIEFSIREQSHPVNTGKGGREGAAQRVILLIPSIGAPREAKRRLLASVVNSKLLYVAPIWQSALNNHAILKKLFSAQRGVVLRIVSAYRTVSTSAVLVLASVPPIDLLAQERKETF